MIRLVAALAAGFFAAIPAAHAIPTDLDPSFGRNGKFNVFIGNRPAEAKRLMLLPSGKFLVAGRGVPLGGERSVVAQFNADGTLDTAGYNADSTARPGRFVSASPFDGAFRDAAFEPSTSAVLVVASDGVSNGSLMRVINGFLWPGFSARDPNFARVRVQPDGRIVTLGFLFRGPPDNHFYFILRRYGANGTPDTSFGPDGRREFAVGISPFSAATALAIQPDGKYVAAGYTFNGAHYDMVTIRVNADGSLDTSFGSGGEVATDIAGTHDVPNAIAVQPDGRILLAGYYHSGGNEQFALVRYLADGALDASFGSGGMVLGGSSNGSAFTGVALQGDGRIVLSGYVTAPSTIYPSFAAARFNADGSADPSFAGGVRVLPKLGVTGDRANDVAIQADGRILLAGASTNSGDDRWLLARLMPDGSDDASFGTGLFSLLPDLVESPESGFRAVKVRPDGRVLAAGYGNSGFALAQFVNGIPDESFGTHGRATAGNSDPFNPNRARSLALQPDGKALVAGVSQQGTCSFARFDTAGLLDPTFGVAGKVTSPMQGFGVEEPGAAVALQADGKIVAACAVLQGVKLAWGVMRMNANGSFDTGFGTSGNGVVVTQTGTSYDLPYAIAVQADGKIVVAGKTRRPDNVYRMLVIRYNADGSIDTGFGTGGAAQFGFVDYASAWLTSMLLLPDGKIVVAGTADLGAGVPAFGVARLVANGTLDASFGNGGKVGVGFGIAAVLGGLDRDESGRLYLVGHTGQAAIARLLPNGTPDDSFAPDGKAQIPLNQNAYAVAVEADGKVVLAGGDADGTHELLLKGAVVARPAGGALPVAARFDFDSSARPDIVFRNASSGDTFIWRMNGLALQSDLFLANIDPSWRLVGHGDFNGDRKNDVVWRNDATGAAYVWYLNDGVLQSDALLFAIDPVWKIEAIADFNGDGHPDFLFRHQSSGLAFLWYFENTTPIGDRFLFSIDNSWIIENVGDFDNDGFPDFFFRNLGSGVGFVWHWNGDSLGASSYLFSIDPVWQVVQIVDWNGDGEVDLMFRNADTGVVFVWYTNGTSLQGSDFLFQVDPAWEIVPYR